MYFSRALSLSGLALPLFAFGCGGGAPAVVAPETPAADSQEVLACGEGELVLVRQSPAEGALALRWGTDDYSLTPNPDAPGEQYQGQGVVLSVVDGHTSVSLPDGRTVDCRGDEPGGTITALLERGGLLWAAGSEPGWTLALEPTRFHLVADYGEAELDGDITETSPVGDSGTVVYRGAGPRGSVEVTVTPGLCRDGMSGARFGATVKVVRGELPLQPLEGCGLPLAD